MDFFSSIPARPWPDDDDEEEASSKPAWFGPPAEVLGVTLPERAVVARTEHVIVALTRVTAFPEGLGVHLTVAVRRGDWSRERWADVEASFWGSSEGPGPSARRRPDLRLGVELADGSRTSVDASPRWTGPHDDPPPAPVLVDRGGGGSGGGRLLSSRRRLWLWPLPEGPTFDLVVAWTAVDLPETWHTVDGASARQAASAAEPFWPPHST